MTLNEVLYQVKSELYGGSGTDDTLISLELMEVWVRTGRAKLIRQLYNRQSPINDLIMPFCVPMSMADASLCCSWEAGCTVLRSTDKLPKTLSFGEASDGITSVNSLDGFTGTNYSRTTAVRAKVDSKSKFAGGRFFLQADYLYISPGNPNTDKLLVWVIPENPIEWYDLDECETGDCEDSWDKFYIPDHFINDLVRIIKVENGFPTRQIPKDTQNDTKED